MKDSLFHSSPMIDLHTHSAVHLDRSDILEIVSTSAPLHHQVYSLERHPWYLTNELNEQDQLELKSLLHDSNCLALGEIGLDKLKGVSFVKQITILRSLLTVAAQEQKPVILHCVKAFDEIIQLKGEYSTIPNWVLHGFNKHAQLAEQLIAHGFYLSLNVTKIRHTQELLSVIPENRLFLETDNSSTLIEDNYLHAAKLLGVELDELQVIIAQNAKHFFGHE